MKLRVEIAPGVSGQGYYARVYDETGRLVLNKYCLGFLFRDASSQRVARKTAKRFIKNYNKNHYEVEV